MLSTLLVGVLCAQAAAPAASLEVEQVRTFLRTARIVAMKDLAKGTTRPRRATLTDGTLTHDAVFQAVDEFLPVQHFASGRVELDFRDSWHFNIAAFELARRLGLEHMVPAAVERKVGKETGSMVWWVDWRWDEQTRLVQHLNPPDPIAWRQQWDVARVFTALVDDTDRNQTNMLITADWRLWMVDFTRAFRTVKKLRNPDVLGACSRDLLDRLRALDGAELRTALGAHLRAGEIDALLARRTLIVSRLEKLIAERGEQAVLF